MERITEGQKKDKIKRLKKPLKTDLRGLFKEDAFDGTFVLYQDLTPDRDMDKKEMLVLGYSKDSKAITEERDQLGEGYYSINIPPKWRI